MLLTVDNIAVGLNVKCIYPAAFIEGKKAIIRSFRRGISYTVFDVEWDDGTTYWNIGWNIGYGCVSYFEIIETKVYRKPKKIIPDIPLDPTLPILMAGHLQDRMRKRF